MVNWHTVVAGIGPCATPLIMKPHDAANALAAIVLERHRLLALRDQLSFSTSSISSIDMSGFASSIGVTHHLARLVRALSAARCGTSVALLVAPLARMHVFELQRLLVQLRLHCPCPRNSHAAA